jgi:mono/diheme cytochrome c family protein
MRAQEPRIVPNSLKKVTVIMVITIKQVKKMLAGIFVLSLFSIVLLTTAPISTLADGDDVAATYKTKCAMCHGANAEKAFDATKPDDALIDAVLKGVKPKMPSYDQKLTIDQAKQLVAYMKTLRK